MVETGGFFQESDYRKVSTEKAEKSEKLEKPAVYKMEDSKNCQQKSRLSIQRYMRLRGSIVITTRVNFS